MTKFEKSFSNSSNKMNIRRILSLNSSIISTCNVNFGLESICGNTGLFTLVALFDSVITIILSFKYHRADIMTKVVLRNSPPGNIFPV